MRQEDKPRLREQTLSVRYLLPGKLIVPGSAERGRGQGLWNWWNGRENPEWRAAGRTKEGVRKEAEIPTIQ